MDSWTIVALSVGVILPLIIIVCMLFFLKSGAEPNDSNATDNHYRRYCDLADVLEDGLASVGPLFKTPPPPDRIRISLGLSRVSGWDIC